MALIVEDGTGIANANAFADVAFADSYFADRGITDWAALVIADKEFYLIRATDYINNRFKFKGTKYSTTQALEFPRVHDDFDLMPTVLKKACCEYAIRAKTAPLAPDPVVDESGRGVASKTEKVGPISESTTFATTGPGSSIANFRPYPAADILLKGLILSSRRVIRG